jgi:hypothetical protein
MMSGLVTGASILMVFVSDHLYGPKDLLMVDIDVVNELCDRYAISPP